MGKFKNPWGKGGSLWDNSLLQSKAIDSQSDSNFANGLSGVSEMNFDSNIPTPLGEDACLDTLVQVIIQQLESIRSQYEGSAYSIGLLDQIFSEVSGLPGSRVDSGFGDCCGTIYGVGVYGLKSENKGDFIDENSPDFYMENIILDTALLGNEKFGDNGYTIATIPFAILKTSRPDRFIKINIGLYRNDVCAV